MDVSLNGGDDRDYPAAGPSGESPDSIDPEALARGDQAVAGVKVTE
ncbi:MAG: hypothetical protein HOH66_16660 [Rhodospirillaceae bacterium]|jgi:hypothetical protein|nr:hypothetical protein [Rhodospirillaceae bacterium]MBT6119495.1 hypothetical protein [Rhodospirillaceae bacterium]